MELVKSCIAASGRSAPGNAREEEPATAIAIVDYLRTIAEGIISGLSKSGEIMLHADSRTRFVLPINKAVSLGLIVGELVTNSIKYAHPAGVGGVIGIDLFRLNGAIVIEVSDDGVGLPEGLNPIGVADTGLARVRALVARIGGFDHIR